MNKSEIRKMAKIYNAAKHGIRLPRRLVQRMRALIMDIPSGVSAAGESDTWVMWKDWNSYCTRADKILRAIDKNAKLK